LSEAALRVALSLQKVVSGNSRFMNQAFEKILAKTCRMGRREADVFVQMKYLDAAPIDIRLAGERVQKLKLRGACSRDNA
jgi:hypothetical protein